MPEEGELQWLARKGCSGVRNIPVKYLVPSSTLSEWAGVRTRARLSQVWPDRVPAHLAVPRAGSPVQLGPGWSLRPKSGLRVSSVRPGGLQSKLSVGGP